MLLKVKEIGNEGLPVVLPVSAAWLKKECPDLDARPSGGGLALRGTLQKSGSDFLLRGELRGGLVTSCARCLEAAPVPIDVPVAVTFVEREPDDGREDADADVDVVLFDGGEIDLSTELRDELLLAMPLTALCRPDCAGLCAVCGGNRNQAPCDCEDRQRMASSKLSGLAKLKL